MKYANFLILLILVACNDSLPKLSELGATNINNADKLSFDTSYDEIQNVESSYIISGRCDPRHLWLEVSLNNQSWIKATDHFNGTGTDLDCSDGRFSIHMDSIKNYLTFNEETFKSTVSLRGNLGFIYTNATKLELINNDSRRPTTPKFNTISKYDGAQVKLTQLSTSELPISHYDCRFKNSEWRKCFNADGSPDSEGAVNATTWQFPINEISIGEEGPVSVRATSQSSNLRSNYQTKSVRRGQIGRGFDGQINGVIKVGEDRYLVYGNIQHYDQEVARGFAKLDLEGRFDPSFRLGMGVDSQTTLESAVTDFNVDSYGNFFLTGNFPSYNNRSTKNFTKLFPTGDNHTDFIPTTGFNNIPSSLEIEDDKVRLDFISTTNSISYNGVPIVGKSIRLENDGTKDSTFQCAGNMNLLRSILRDDQGNYATLEDETSDTTGKTIALYKRDASCAKGVKILGHDEVSINGDDHLTYASVNWSPFTSIFKIDDRFYLAGNFNRIANTDKNNCLTEFSLNDAAILNNSTDIFRNFVPEKRTGLSYYQCIFDVKADNHNLLSFSYLSGSTRYSHNYRTSSLSFNAYPIATMTNLKTVATSATHQNSLYYVFSGEALKVLNTTTQAQQNTLLLNNLTDIKKIRIINSSLYLGGSFRNISNPSKKSGLMALIDGNGNIIKTYQGSAGTIRKILPLTSNRFVAVGNFTSLLGTNIKNYAVIETADVNSTSLPDDRYSFQVINTVNGDFRQFAFPSVVNDVAVDGDKNIYLTGQFKNYSFNGHVRNGIIKLNSLGQIDPSFNVNIEGTNSTNGGYSILLENDLIFIGGSFTSVSINNNSVPSGGGIILNKDGSLHKAITNSSTSTTMIKMLKEGNYIYFIDKQSSRTYLKFYDSSITQPVVTEGCYTSYSRLIPNFTIFSHGGKIKVSVQDKIFSYIPSTLACDGSITVLDNDAQTPYFSLEPLSDGKFLAFGQFNFTYDKSIRHNIMKLNSDFTVDQLSFGDEH